jgi:hypothetical protein
MSKLKKYFLELEFSFFFKNKDIIYMFFSVNLSVLPYDEVREHFVNHPNEDKRNKIQETLNLLENEGFRIFYVTKKTSSHEDENKIKFDREIQITNENLETIERRGYVGESICHFSISGKYDMNTHNDYFDSGETIDMGIGSEEVLPSGEPLRGREISRIMMGELLMQCLKEYPTIRDEQLLFIDADGSSELGGRTFWDIIGMKENDDIDGIHRREGEGYEKQIDFKTIFEWVFGKNIPRNKRKSSIDSNKSKRRRKRGGKKRKTAKYIKKNIKYKI